MQVARVLIAFVLACGVTFGLFYLMQTMIALALFTGVGLGWGTRVSAWQFEVLALAVFVVEVRWSRWWLARFQYGPFEYVWRSLTYGKVMPMRR